MTIRAVAVLGMGVLKADELVLAADDLGLTRGDGCFEATRVVTAGSGSHRIDHLDSHLDRFQQSSRSLDLPDVDQPAWRSLIEELLADWDEPGEAMLKLMITRGRESMPDGPITGIATLTPISAVSLRQRHDGVAVATLSRGTAADAFAEAPWLLGGVKTLSYGVNVAAQRVAVERGADDVIFTSSDGYVLEAPTSAVVWHDSAQLFTTPTGGTGILSSITQRALFDGARRDGLRTYYRLGTVDDLLAADGVWLVSSGRGIAQVTAIDGKPTTQSSDLTAQLRGWAGF